MLSALQRAKVRRLSKPKEVDGDTGGELNVVPFLDIIVNVLIFVLATVAVVFTSVIAVKPPATAKPTETRPAEGLRLHVFIVTEGFAIKARGANVAPGCEDSGPGLAVPAVGGRLDFDALRRCVDKLKRETPEVGQERQIVLTANPGVDYQTLIATTDAVRTDARGALLFDQVAFGVPR